MNLATNPSSRRNQGYSLVELLLTTALLLLFAGLAVVSMQALSQGSTFNEGTIRFETLLRYAHAEAARSGHRVRVNFIQSTNQITSTNQLTQVQLTWEPDPVGSPDVFQELQGAQWGVDQVNEAVGVETVHFTENPAESPTETDPDADSVLGAYAPAVDETENTTPPWITFNPDGSCDSAEITLAGLSVSDDQRVTFRVEGFTGTVMRVEPASTDEDDSNPETARETEHPAESNPTR